jgi:hypothetical protein
MGDIRASCQSIHGKHGCGTIDQGNNVLGSEPTDFIIILPWFTILCHLEPMRALLPRVFHADAALLWCLETVFVRDLCVSCPLYR